MTVFTGARVLKQSMKSKGKQSFLRRDGAKGTLILAEDRCTLDCKERQSIDSIFDFRFSVICLFACKVSAKRWLKNSCHYDQEE